MAANFHIKIDSIPGSSEDAGFEKQIDVEHFGWGMRQPTSFKKGSGGGAGAVDMQDLTFVHFVDAATPKLMLLCCTGEHLGEATLVCSRAGGDSVPYLTIKLKDVVISSVSPNSAGGAIPTETVTIAFAEWEAEYLPQDNKGKKGAAVSHGFSVQKNKKTK